MAVGINVFHSRRIYRQIEDNLTGLQRDMNQNAESHLAMATAQSPAAAVLRTFMNDAAQSYLQRLQWVIDLRNDPVRRTRLLAVFTALGIDENELIDFVTSLRNAAIALRDASKSNYVQMATAAQAVIDAVELPDSLWPE
jgi:hypothetical protein